MKILVISDTHGNANRAYTAYTRSEPVDMIIHLGDGSADADMLRDAVDVPVINIAGNCDIGSTAQRERIWECEGKRILLTHGDAYRVKYGLDRLGQRAREIGADAVLFGHTHLKISEEYSGLLLVNPGTLASYASNCSYAVLEVTPQGISCHHYDIV
jgi:putative phosphoesterase